MAYNIVEIPLHEVTVHQQTELIFDCGVCASFGIAFFVVFCIVVTFAIKERFDRITNIILSIIFFLMFLSSVYYFVEFYTKLK